MKWNNSTQYFKFLFRSSHRRCSMKKVFFKNFTAFTGKHLRWTLFLIKLQPWGRAALLKKEFSTGFSCEYCEIFKSTYFEEHLRTAAPAVSWNFLRISQKVFCRMSVNNSFSWLSGGYIRNSDPHSQLDTSFYTSSFRKKA